MKGKRIAPENLPLFESELGETCAQSICFFNPLGRAIDVYASSSNPSNFKISCEKRCIDPYDSIDFEVLYEPTSIKIEERSLIILESVIAGKWEYNCIGKVTFTSH